MRCCERELSRHASLGGGCDADADACVHRKVRDANSEYATDLSSAYGTLAIARQGLRYYEELCYRALAAREVLVAKPGVRRSTDVGRDAASAHVPICGRDATLCWPRGDRLVCRAIRVRDRRLLIRQQDARGPRACARADTGRRR